MLRALQARSPRGNAYFCLKSRVKEAFSGLQVPFRRRWLCTFMANSEALPLVGSSPGSVPQENTIKIWLCKLEHDLDGLVRRDPLHVIVRADKPW